MAQDKDVWWAVFETVMKPQSLYNVGSKELLATQEGLWGRVALSL